LLRVGEGIAAIPGIKDLICRAVRARAANLMVSIAGSRTLGSVDFANSSST
jgi:hypothetical protein